MDYEAEQDLKACFDLTDWSVFEAAANDLDELTETVTSYISFCEDMCILTRTHLTYNNDKPGFEPWQNSDSSVRPKKMPTERGIKSCINRPNTHWKRRSEWQRGILIKLMNKLSSSVSASVWKGMKEITSFKTPSPRTVENQQLADELNEFYCRFEKTPFTPPATPTYPTLALQISEDVY